MGSFLDRPKTEKETLNVDGNDLKAGMSAMQGWRVDMEVRQQPFTSEVSLFSRMFCNYLFCRMPIR
jgi:hypothetical protein